MATANLQVGARCEINGSWGVIRFIGVTSFSSGKWVGVELDEPKGKNDGSVKGKKYFECKEKHGVFVRPSQLKTIVGPNSPTQDRSRTPQNDSTQFAPAHDPQAATARSRLRSSSIISNSGIPSRINTAGTPRSPRGTPSPTGSRANVRTPSSPTFAKRQRLPSEVTNIDMKRMSILSLSELDDGGEDDADLMDDTIDEVKEDMATEELLPKAEIYTTATETTASSSSDPFSLQESTHTREQMVSLKDYEELRLKLKILENKRAEDREKMRETEKMRQEAEQFLSVKPKLQGLLTQVTVLMLSFDQPSNLKTFYLIVKLTDMQAEMRDLRRQLKEAISEKEIFEARYNEVSENMEMMTLDKEVAEERVENLQHEVIQLKEKIEEISVDLNVFKQEGRQKLFHQGDGSDARPAVEVRQLELQNARLKEALVRLRDVTSEQEAELQKKLKAAEKELTSLQDIQVQCDQLKQQLRTADSHIEDLKLQLDDALGAEDMVERLTEKNLAMGEKLEEMKATIEDLEALKELADELEESHIENEKQLQAEIDHKDIQIRDFVKRLEIADETNADYENTINQFRELVANLQSDLEQMRQREASHSSESNDFSSRSQAMLNLNYQLQSTVMKAQAKQIDLELRKLDATQASDNLAYVQSYLPDSFFTNDNDSIRCLLLMKRLVFKSELVIKQLDQIHNIPEKLNSTVPEELISVCEMRQKLAWFADLSKRFVSFINCCNVETFLKMGQVYQDLVGTERRLNHIVELLRKEELKENDYIGDVQKSIVQLEHLAELYLSSTRVDEGDKFYGFARAIDLNADTISVTLGHIKQAVALACKDEEITVTDGSELFTNDFFQPVQSLFSQAKSSKVVARKLLRRLDDLNGQDLTLKPDLLSQFKSCYLLSAKISNFWQEVRKGISVYINERKGSKEVLQLSGLHHVVYKATEDILGVNEMQIWEGCTKLIQELFQDVGNLNNTASDNDRTEPISKGESPWVIRAKNIKAEVAVNVDMERKLQQAAEEIRELFKELKLKDQSLQENQIKIDLLEKRMETAKKQADLIAELEEQLTETRKQQNLFEKTMESLHADIDSLEQENRQFKSLAKTLEETGRQNSPVNQNFAIPDDEEIEETTMPTDTNPIETQRLASQIESLKFAVRYLRAENAHLKGKDAMTVLNLHLLPNKSKDARNDDLVKSMATEAKTLLKDFRSVSASPRIIDLSKTTTAHKGWQPRKNMPEYHFHAQRSTMYTLQKRSDELKSKMQQLGKLKKVKTSKGHIGFEPPFVGRIQVPLPESSIPTEMAISRGTLRHNIKLQNAADYEKIHTIFVN
ncbi:7705_t:CDS:10 [Paraglomus occultum]|uniref:7705_t:CDS:1 n=1 Tax=Paraglomus occultum TaxID=144539 RepID=A0A9N9FVY8_9GLOM|nr:7705_t:CDS:10 [Paraglomus occultum]